MPNKFQRAIVSTTETITFANFYLDDVIIASKEAFTNTKTLYRKILSSLNDYDFAVKRTKSKNFLKLDRLKSSLQLKIQLPIQLKIHQFEKSQKNKIFFWFYQPIQ